MELPSRIVVATWPDVTLQQWMDSVQQYVVPNGFLISVSKSTVL